VLKLTGGRGTLRFLPLPADDPRQRRPDIDRARALLGFEPRVSLREGLERTIASFQLVRAAGPIASLPSQRPARVNGDASAR
jgi:UDP-glucuronate decarboxylase